METRGIVANDDVITTVGEVEDASSDDDAVIVVLVLVLVLVVREEIVANEVAVEGRDVVGIRRVASARI